MPHVRRSVLVTIDAAPDTPVLWVLRDHLGMTGTKFGCGKTLCRACTVYLNGTPTFSCRLPLSSVAGYSVITIEGLQGRVAEAVLLVELRLLLRRVR